jgi:hypothetical protein
MENYLSSLGLRRCCIAMISAYAYEAIDIKIGFEMVE